MTDLVAAYDPREHSRVLLDGPDRSAARSMLKAIGFTDEDLSTPIIGVGTTWIETVPCNYNQRKLAFRVTTSAVARRRRRSGRPTG
jgi:dihydroxy-acid dehydratase